MNMHNNRLITAAEQAIADSYEAVKTDLPGDEALAEQRRSFIEDIKVHGLPTRRVEAWHYTDLRSLLKAVPSPTSGASVSGIDPLVEGSHVVSLVNGRVESNVAVPELRGTSYRDSLTGDNAAHAIQVRGEDDVIGRVNGALAGDGCELSLSANAKLEGIVELQFLHGGGQAHTRSPVEIGANASGVFVERHLNTGEGEALVSAITDLTVGDGADITWVIFQSQAQSDTHLGQINVKLGAGAKLKLFVANAGGQLVRQEIHVSAHGEDSELMLRGVNLLGGTSHTDVTLTLDHIVPNCASSETFRNVVCDRARGVFQGQIKVAPIAQKTDAQMACNSLLLSDDGDFSCKPELEIFADDVQCAHGATVTDIDENHLFYMRARGISEKQARAMLVKAFIAEVVEDLEHEQLIEALEEQLENWLDEHG